MDHRSHRTPTAPLPSPAPWARRARHLLLGAAALAGASLLGACATGAAGNGVSPGVTPGGGLAAASTTSGTRSATAVSDWAHVLEVVANLQHEPPAEPLVLLLGGSAARECTISDASWARQVLNRGGPAVVTYNLGSRNRITAQDIALVKALPETPTIVYIGVNVGRFTSAKKTAGITLPSPGPLSPYKQHRYSSKKILTASNKRLLVQRWMRDRYPVFQRNFTVAAANLERLIKACKAQGLHPVLLDLPRNMPIIRTTMNKPIGRYQATCRTLAKKHGIPYVNLNGTARLQNKEFYDLWHLVEPGRVKWQRLLSDRTIALLKRYGMVPPAEPAEPSASPEPTSSAAPAET